MSTAAPAKPPRSWAGVPLPLIIVIGVALFVGHLGIYAVPIQIGSLMDWLGISAAGSGMLGTAELLAIALTSIAVSPRVTSWNLSRLAVGGALLAAAAELLTLAADAGPALFAARITVGVGCGAVYAAVCAIAAGTGQPDRVFAAGTALMNGGFLVLFAVLPHVSAALGPQAVFPALGLLLACFAPFLGRLPPSPGLAAETEGQRSRAAPAAVVSHFAGLVCLNLGLGATWGFAERMGLDAGATPVEVGNILSASMLPMIGGCLLATVLGARYGRTLPVLVASLCCAISAFGMAAGLSVAVYTASVMLYGAAYLFVGPYVISGIPSALDPSGRLAAAAGGTMWLSYSLGLTAGGLIVDLASTRGIGWLALVGCSAAAPLFFAASRAGDALPEVPQVPGDEGPDTRLVI